MKIIRRILYVMALFAICAYGSKLRSYAMIQTNIEHTDSHMTHCNAVTISNNQTSRQTKNVLWNSLNQLTTNNNRNVHLESTHVSSNFGSDVEWWYTFDCEIAPIPGGVGWKFVSVSNGMVHAAVYDRIYSWCDAAYVTLSNASLTVSSDGMGVTCSVDIQVTYTPKYQTAQVYRGTHKHTTNNVNISVW